MGKSMLSRAVSATIVFVMVVAAVSIPALSNDGVYAAAKKTKLSKKKATVTIGTPLTLTVKKSKADTKKKVKWSSSKKSIASVNKSGKIVAKKPGKTTITAKVGKKKYKCKVTVPAPSGSRTNPFLAKNGVSIVNANGAASYTFQVTSTAKNDAAVNSLANLGQWDNKTNDPDNYSDSEKYASYRGNYDLVLFEIAATNNSPAAGEYIYRSDVFTPYDPWDEGFSYTLGCENIIKTLGYKSYTPVGYDSSIEPGKSGKFLVSIYVKKGNSYLMSPLEIYSLDAEGDSYPIGLTWVKYSY